LDDYRDDLNSEGEDELEVLILVDDDGQEHSFELIAELELEGQHYVVVAPIDEEADEDEEEVDITILKATFDEEGNMYLADIDDDEEWEKVADAWQELVESEELE